MHPLALETLRRHALPVEGLRSKSWQQFEEDDAPQLDFVFSLCGSAAREECPVWLGHPLTAHWATEDPAAFEGDDEAMRQAFNDVFLLLRRRIELCVALPLDQLDDPGVREQLTCIGRC